MIDTILKVMLAVAFCLIALCALCVLSNELCDCVRDDEQYLQEAEPIQMIEPIQLNTRQQQRLIPVNTNSDRLVEPEFRQNTRNNEPPQLFTVEEQQPSQQQHPNRSSLRQ